MKDNICGHCSYMRPTDGWCRRLNRYANFFDEAKCFNDEKPKKEPKERKKRVLAHPPGTWTEARRKAFNDGREKIAKRTHKVCPTCHRLLPLDAFVKSKRDADGHGCYCKACFAAKVRERRKAANKL